MRLKISLVLLLLLVLTPVVFIKTQKPLISAPPTNVKDTLDSSQLSYFARILSATQGQSIITVGTTAAPNTTATNLSVGDTLAIGTTGVGVGISGPLTIYTVKDIGLGATNVIQLNAGIGQSNSFVGAAVIATRSAIHTISWTPQTNLSGGFWQFLIKATSNVGETINDGIPDQGGFDLGQDVGGTTVGLGTRLKQADVFCPNFATGVGSTTAYSIGTTALNGSTYHLITCALGAGNTNAIGVGYTATIGRPLTSGSQLINPTANQSGHIVGAAETYTFYVRHLNSSSVLDDADTMQGKIAVVEAVRVTATVDPTLTFTIDNTNIGTTACGVALKDGNANTTAASVPFGSLALGTFNNLAQRLSVTTNGTSYVVTVYENMTMRNISTGTTILDTNCDAGYACTTSTYNNWMTDTTESGFGYSIQNTASVGTTIFNYNMGVGGSLVAKPFGAGAANSKSIFSHAIGTQITQTETAYVCYRLVAGITQEAGNYENEVIYTATATF